MGSAVQGVPAGLTEESMAAHQIQGVPTGLIAEPIRARDEEKPKSLIQRGTQYLEPKPGEGAVSRFTKGFGRTTIGALGGLADAATREPDITAGDLPVSDATSYLEMVGKRLLVDPSIAANKHVEELAAEHKTKGTPAYYGGKVMADIPVLGPWGLQAGERAGKGDVAGALGETAGIVAGPKASELALRGIKVAVPPIVRGAGKTYNAGRTVGQIVAPVAGVAEGAVRLAHGDLPGAAYSAAGGGFAGRALRMLPRAPESVTNFGLPKAVYHGAPLPDAPPPEVIQARGLQTGGHTPTEPPAGLRGIRVAPPDTVPPPSIVRTPGQIAPEMIRPRAVSPYAPAEPIPARRGLQLAGEIAQPEPSAPTSIRRVPGDIPPLAIRPRAVSPYAPAEPIPPRRGLMLPGEVEKSPAPEYPSAAPRGIARPGPSREPTRPVTENPVVGNLVRAMDKSGVPIAQRPGLLLKGSGRVNRILGPEEDLTDALAKSARQARRQREQ